MNLVFGHDRTVAEWAAAHYASFTPCYRALGIVRAKEGGTLIGAATFHEFNGSNVELCYWGPWSVTLPIARGIVRFCFEDLRVNRMTVRCARSNRVVKQGLPKMGFRFEAVLRRFYGPAKSQDAIVFGLLIEDAGRLLGRRA